MEVEICPAGNLGNRMIRYIGGQNLVGVLKFLGRGEGVLHVELLGPLL